MKKETKMMLKMVSRFGLGLIAAAAMAGFTFAQTTVFSYQGKLDASGAPANGNYDFEFKLFDAASGGTQQGATAQRLNVGVVNGVYAVSLDFGAGGLTGADRYLDIAVRTAGGGAFTQLAPRQQVMSTPYAVRSLNAGTASALSCAGCVSASQIGSVNGSAVTGTIPAASVPSGSGSYIQNQNAAPQPVSNFNISGNGTVAGTLSGNVVNSTQYRLGGLRTFAVSGVDSYLSNNFGAVNTFVGESTGINTVPNPTPGNSLGKWNSFFGVGTGQTNVQGSDNAFFGALAGIANTNNANSFFGSQAGVRNDTGGLNTFVGWQAGYRNVSGSTNTFVGTGADFGSDNPIGSGNTLLGIGTKVNTGVNNGTAIGGRALVTQSNSLVLGGISGVNGGTDTNVGIGTTAPSERLHVVGNGLLTGNLTVNGTLNATLPANSGNYIQNTTSPQASSNFNISGNGTAGGILTGNIVSADTEFQSGGARVLGANPATNNTFVGVGAGVSNTTGDQNTFVGRGTGPGNLTGNNNTFLGAAAGNGNKGSNNTAVGRFAGLSITTGSSNTLVGANSNVSSPTLSYAAAFGADAVVGTNNTIVLGRPGGQDAVQIPGSLSASSFSGDGSGLTNITASQTITNVSNLGTLRWDLLRSQRIITPGIQPYGIAFDGANMWVVEFNGSTVKKIRVSDGAVIGTFTVGSNLRFIAFDGANMWVTSTTPGATVFKVRASDGTVLNTYSTPTAASNLAYDGENMWILNGSSVTKLRVSDGANLGNFTAGNSPSGIAFDGAYMWITHLGSDGLRKVNAADGTSVNYFMTTGGGVAFDGNNVWLVNTTAGTVVRIRSLDGAILNSYTIAAGANEIAFDGSNLWVMNSDPTSGTATKIRAADGATLASFVLGAVPIDIAFDGANMWVTNINSGTVMRLAPAFPHP